MGFVGFDDAGTLVVVLDFGFWILGFAENLVDLMGLADSLGLVDLGKIAM